MATKRLIFALVMFLFILPIVYSANMSVQYDDNPVYAGKNDKTYWLLEIPTGYKEYNFTCISYIVKNGEIIQTNPKHTESTKNFINYVIPVLEVGEYFQTNNGIASVYFTTEKLKIDGILNFTYGVKCSSGSTSFKEERIIVPTYENLDFVGARWVWVGDNMVYIISGLLLLVIILLTLGAILRK